MTKYEVMYIIRPNIEEDAKAALVERFNAVLAEGAEILEVNDWGKRRLAYEINDFTDGYYMIVNVQAETAASTQEFDRLAKISEDIIRHMIVKVEA